MPLIYDIAVIGNGMIGSAAARYLAQSGRHTLLVGADEPINGKASLVYSSHDDAARIFRRVGVDEVWTELNRLSAAVFPSLIRESGIPFHFPVGCLYVSEYRNDPVLECASKVLDGIANPPRLLNQSKELRDLFPAFHFPFGVRAMFEPAPSGYIRPLDLIRAQNRIFQQNGGLLETETVTELRRDSSSYVLRLQNDKLVRAKKVLVCAGAFSNFFQLLDRKLQFHLESETVLLAEVRGEIPDFPCLLWETSRQDYEGIYMIGPVHYPDGRWYIKMGCNLSSDLIFEDLESIQDWFGNAEHEKNRELLLDIFFSVLPGLEITSARTKPCIITRTAHGKPYIGMVGDGLFVAAGGNGYSAKCSDALGKLAAAQVMDLRWDAPFTRDVFKPVFSTIY